MSPTQPTPYADLNAVLRELIARLQTVLRDDFIGAYLQGSFAIGDFDIYSDVDFLIVLEEDVSDVLVPQLQSLHRNIFDMGAASRRVLCPPGFTQASTAAYPRVFVSESRKQGACPF